MTSGKHIATDALALAALPATSLQRQAAEAHARTCPDCARALRQGERVLEMLDAGLDVPAPSLAVLRRAMNRTRRVAALHIAAAPVLTVVAISAAIASFSSFSGEGLRWLGSAMLAILGVGLSWLAVSGRTVRWIAGAVFLGSVMFAAALAGDGPLAPVLGIRCCLAELVPVAIAIAVIFGLRQSAVFRDPCRCAGGRYGPDGPGGAPRQLPGAAGRSAHARLSYGRPGRHLLRRGLACAPACAPCGHDGPELSVIPARVPVMPLNGRPRPAIRAP